MNIINLYFRSVLVGDLRQILLFFSTLTPMKVDILQSPYSSEEIKRAVLDCATTEAPGPDGFSF